MKEFKIKDVIELETGEEFLVDENFLKAWEKGDAHLPLKRLFDKETILIPRDMVVKGEVVDNLSK